MRSRLLTALVFATGWLAPISAWPQDATKVQPTSYRLVFENSSVRVLEYNAVPGMGVCGSGVHSHPAHLTVLLSPAQVKVTENGHSFVTANKPGDVFWSEAVTHETENVGGANVRSLLIELKTPVHGR